MKRQPNFTPGRKMSVRSRAHGFSAVRAAALLVAVGAAVFAAAWFAHYFSPTTRLTRRTFALARSVHLDCEPLPPLEVARRLAVTESALASEATAEFTWNDGDGDTWQLEGRRELKDLHARLLAEAPRLGLWLVAPCLRHDRTGPGAIDTTVWSDIRVFREAFDPIFGGQLTATLRWRKTADGWKIVRAEFRLDDAPPDVP